MNMRLNRHKTGLSQATLAEKIGTATNYISKIESEKQFPSIPMLERIAIALNIDVLELFSIKNSQMARLNEVKQALQEIIAISNDTLKDL